MIKKIREALCGTEFRRNIGGKKYAPAKGDKEIYNTKNKKNKNKKQERKRERVAGRCTSKHYRNIRKRL